MPPGSMKMSDGDRDVALRDQVVEDRHDILPRGCAVLKHHDCRRARRVVLRRHVDPPVAGRPRENLAAPRRHLLDAALRHAGAFARVRMGFVHLELSASQPRAAGFVMPRKRGAVREIRDAGVEPARSHFGERQVEHAVVGDGPRRRARRGKIRRLERKRDGQLVGTGGRAFHQYLAAAEVGADAVCEPLGFCAIWLRARVPPTGFSDRASGPSWANAIDPLSKVTAMSTTESFMMRQMLYLFVRFQSSFPPSRTCCGAAGPEVS